GQAPFRGNPVEIRCAVAQGAFPPPRKVKREVPPAMEAICLQAMALQPAERYATAKALAEDVARWLADEALSTYREPWPVRVGRWCRQRRTVVAILIATLVGLLVTSAGGLVLWHFRGQRELELEYGRRQAELREQQQAQRGLDHLQATGKTAEKLALADIDAG